LISRTINREGKAPHGTNLLYVKAKEGTLLMEKIHGVTAESNGWTSLA